MDIKIDNKEKNYIFKPVSKEEEVLQNIENIVLRVKYNVPLARHKGIIADNVDKPQEIAKAEIVADISEEIDREEPRFSVQELKVSDEIIEQGKLSLNVKGVVIDG